MYHFFSKSEHIEIKVTIFQLTLPQYAARQWYGCNIRCGWLFHISKDFWALLQPEQAHLFSKAYLHSTNLRFDTYCLVRDQTTHRTLLDTYSAWPVLFATLREMNTLFQRSPFSDLHMPWRSPPWVKRIGCIGFQFLHLSMKDQKRSSSPLVLCDW